MGHVDTCDANYQEENTILVDRRQVFPQYLPQEKSPFGPISSWSSVKRVLVRMEERLQRWNQIGTRLSSPNRETDTADSFTPESPIRVWSSLTNGHWSCIACRQKCSVTKEHEHEVISIGYWGTEFMWTIQIKILCKTQKIVLAFMTRIGWVDVRFEPPLWLRLPSWILMALSSKSSGSALLASRNFEIQICVHSCSVVGLWSNFCKGIERVNNCRWSYTEVNFPARALCL